MGVAALTAHPAFAAFRPWFPAASVAGYRLDELNAFAGACSPPPASATGARIRFVAAAGRLSAHDYERRIHATGEVSTRPGVPHDMLNAICWLAFPAIKRACNALHVAHGAGGGAGRGAVRDAVTLFDESGIVALSSEPALAGLLGARQWRAAFCERRAAVQRALRFFVCGHAVLEKLLDPYPGITARVLFVPGDDLPFDGDERALRAEADRRAAAALALVRTPRDLPLLPLAGIPGWDPRNADPAFYDDRSVFRTGRR